MRHPTEAVLRRLLDEPAGVSDPDRRHVAGCPQCLGALPAALPSTLPAALPATLAERPAERFRARRTGTLLRRPLAAVLAVGVVLAGAGAAAANDWLPVLRTEQIEPVGLSTADLVALPDLSGYGDLQVTGDGDLHQVADAAAAAAETGLEVPAVTELPRGVTGEPSYQVVGRLSATFTFSADRAARTAAAAGEPLPPAPPGLDGSQLRLVAGPGVGQVWASSSGVPALLVGRAVAPSVASSGLPFEPVRDYLLSLPGLPDDIAGQLRTFTADGSTLPLPVPTDRVSTSTAQVHGVPATVLATRDRTMSAVLWVQGGVVTAVAGSPDSDELLAVARGLG